MNSFTTFSSENLDQIPNDATSDIVHVFVAANAVSIQWKSMLNVS